MQTVFSLKRDQILVLIAKDFKLKYNSTALGFAWSLIVPFFTSLVYYFVFGVMMRWDAENYLLYLVSGTFMWQFFSNVVMMNGGVLMANSSLLKKTSFDRGLLIWGTFFTESIHFLLTIPILLLVMWFYGVVPHWPSLPLNLIVSMILLSFFTVGVSYAYAAANLYFRDLERIMNIVMLVWMFLSPVFIPITAVPKQYLWIYDINPMAGIMNIWRDIFYQPGLHTETWITLGLISGLTWLLGRWIFKALEPRFAEMM